MATIEVVRGAACWAEEWNLRLPEISGDPEQVWVSIGDITFGFFHSVRSAMRAKEMADESPWFCRRLGLLDSDQWLVGPLCIVERG